MSAEQAARIVERLIGPLGLLPEWEIEVGGTCLEPDTRAQVVFADHRHAARIEVGPDWPEDPEEQVWTIGHELAHIVINDLYETGCDAIEALPKRERRIFDEALTRQNERLADRLGRIFARLDEEVAA